MTSRADYWRQLAQAGLMQPPPETGPAAAWYVRALQGFAAWIASLFLIGAVLALLGFDDNPGALYVFGALFIAGAWFLLRARLGDFAHQASLALSLAGQLCITIALIQHSDTLAVAAGVTVLGLVLIAAMDDFAHRLLAALVVCGGIVTGAMELQSDWTAPSLLAVAFAAAWASELRWGRVRNVLEPVAVGFGFGLLVSVLFISLTMRFNNPELLFGEAAPWSWFAFVEIALIVASVGWVTRGAIDDCALRAGRYALALAIALAAALALELAVLGSGVALLVLVAAVRAQRPVLAIAAIATLLLLVSRWYYAMQVTLLVKALWLIGSGAVLLVLHAIARHRFSERKPVPRAPRPSAIGGTVAGAASVLACLLLVGVGVVRSESVLANGRVMVLQLAPVDPRSLMQGDYMRLRFEVQNAVRERLRNSDPRRGWVIVANDDDGVARFVEITDTKPQSAADRFAIPFRWRAPRLDMLTDAFFFEEGAADVYQPARYGAFRVGDGGRVILETMLDENRQPLGSQY